MGSSATHYFVRAVLEGNELNGTIYFRGDDDSEFLAKEKFESWKQP